MKLLIAQRQQVAKGTKELGYRWKRSSELMLGPGLVSWGEGQGKLVSPVFATVLCMDLRDEFRHFLHLGRSLSCSLGRNSSHKLSRKEGWISRAVEPLTLEQATGQLGYKVILIGSPSISNMANVLRNPGATKFTCSSLCQHFNCETWLEKCFQGISLCLSSEALLCCTAQMWGFP